MNIPFYKPSIDEAEIEEVVQTLKSGWITTGPKTKQFEGDFARYAGHRHAVAVNSCTAALHLALEAVGVKAGDTVVVPTMTFAATAEVVRYFNATPLLVDCRLDDLNLDVADAERRIEAALAEGARITAITPVHYGGQVGDVEGVRRLAAQYKLAVVEDAAHCCPAYFRLAENEPWQTVGTGSDVSCYSFYANKCITTGEGGMACTQRDDYAERMRIMSLHGISKDAWKRFTADGSWYYEIIAPGFKYNLTDIAAAIGIHQLRKADSMREERARVAQTYLRLLADVEELELPRELPNRIHSWHLFAIRLRTEQLGIDRATFMTELKRRGIGASVHWIPLHMHPYYREMFHYAPEELPVAAGAYQGLVSLPIFPLMSAEEISAVCGAIREIIAGALRVSPSLAVHA